MAIRRITGRGFTHDYDDKVFVLSEDDNTGSITVRMHDRPLHIFAEYLFDDWRRAETIR